jgi:hypothetical protein
MEGGAMMGERLVAQDALFYEFSLERHVPDDHWARAIDRFVDLSEIRTHRRRLAERAGEAARVTLADRTRELRMVTSTNSSTCRLPLRRNFSAGR